MNFKKEQKRERCSNFSSKEEEILLALVEQNSKIIENKQTDSVMWDKKKQVWDNISNEFVMLSGVKRSVKNIKAKYDNLKKGLFCLAEEKKEMYLTGGGHNKITKLSNTTERLVALMGDSATGLGNQFDSDCFGNETRKEEGLSICNKKGSVTEPDILYEEFLEESLGAQVDQEPIVLDNTNNDLNNHTPWSSWNPQQLKQPKSSKLTKIPNTRRIQKNSKIVRDDVFSDEKIELMKAQRIFFQNDDKRSEEKHEGEREQAEIKLKILNIELQMKQKEMDKLNRLI